MKDRRAQTSRLAEEDIMLTLRLSRTARLGLGSVLATFLPIAAQAQTPPPDSYLTGATLGSPVSAKPDNRSDTGMLDLNLVREAQVRVDAVERTEAYDDAASYNYYELLPRFSQAADSRLSISSRPILAHTLK
jgi:hypothetical protein